MEDNWKEMVVAGEGEEGEGNRVKDHRCCV
jgi:hypothetical protein